MTVLYLPFLHSPFGTFSLPLVDRAIVIGLSLTISPVIEEAKWMKRRGWFGDRTSLTFDGQWRRMDLGASPQQLLLRPGIVRTLAPGVRVGAGYAFVATAPYGEVPSPAPLREHRAWQQLVLAHAAGPLSVTHRYRWEQRWLAPVGRDAGTGASSTGPWSYQQRARYMVRTQGNLTTARTGGRPLLGYAFGEWLIPVGHGDANARLSQQRGGAGVGVPISAVQRLEMGYLALWNAIPVRRTNEVNHTFTLSWVWTTKPRG